MIVVADSDGTKTNKKSEEDGDSVETTTASSSQSAAALQSASEVMEFAKNYVKRDRRVWTELPPANAAAIVHAITAFYDTGAEMSLEEKMKVAANVSNLNKYNRINVRK